MPARTVIPTDPTEASWETIQTHLSGVLRAHLTGVTRLRVERRNRGPASGPIPEEIEVAFDPGVESAEDCIAEVVACTMKVIREDAMRPRGANTPKSGQVGAWQGRILVIGTAGEKKPIATLDVSIDDPDAQLSAESEFVSMLNVVRVFMKDMCTAMVNIMGASASREQAIADLVTGVAKTQGKSDKYEWRYRWKEQKSRERMHEHEVDAEAAVHRSTATKFFFGGILEKYQPTFDLLARTYATQQGTKPADRKPMPPRPTESELLSVFPVPTSDDPTADVYKDIRSVALAMLRCSDAVERPALQQQIVVELSRLGEQMLVMLAEAERVLGKERTATILAWFRAPWD